MNVYKVPDTLENKYHGAGHALAAVADNHLVDIVYLHDIIDDVDDFDTLPVDIIDNPALAPAVRQLQALGQVSIGMLSGREFVEL